LKVFLCLVLQRSLCCDIIRFMKKYISPEICKCYKAQNGCQITGKVGYKKPCVNDAVKNAVREEIIKEIEAGSILPQAGKGLPEYGDMIDNAIHSKLSGLESKFGVDLDREKLYAFSVRVPATKELQDAIHSQAEACAERYL
jgi:hypothetical protein